MMSFDNMPFYDNVEVKKEQIMEQTGADAATVMSLLADWREQTVDIDSLLQTSNSGRTRPAFQQSQTSSGNSNQIQSQAIYSNMTRQSALDLTHKYGQPEQQQSSPSHSPYTPNVPDEFNYETMTSQRQAVIQSYQAPVSPHSSAVSNCSGTASPNMLHSPVSPMSHMSSHSESLSPVPHHTPPPGVFRQYHGVLPYATSAFDMYPYASGQSKDKCDDSYKVKRERNNIAVRKSREKKKQRETEMEHKVQLLNEDNTVLQTKLEIMIKELDLLKSLYKNIGINLPHEARMKIERELAKLTC